MIELTPVEGSSQIAAAGHDPSTNTLAIRFVSGGVYHYQDVPEAVAEALMAAESKGRFFGAEIKGKFPYTRMPEDTAEQG